MRRVGELIAILLLAAFAFVIAVLVATLLTPHARAQTSQSVGIFCNSFAVYDTNTSGSTLLVTALPDGSTYICGWVLSSVNTVNVKLISGTTGTTCANNTTNLTPAFHFLSATQGSAAIVSAPGNFQGSFVPPGSDICINASAGQSVQAEVWYLQQRGP